MTHLDGKNSFARFGLPLKSSKVGDNTYPLEFVYVKRHGLAVIHAGNSYILSRLFGLIEIIYGILNII